MINCVYSLVWPIVVFPWNHSHNYFQKYAGEAHNNNNLGVLLPLCPRFRFFLAAETLMVSYALLMPIGLIPVYLDTHTDGRHTTLCLFIVGALVIVVFVFCLAHWLYTRFIVLLALCLDWITLAQRASCFGPKKLLTHALGGDAISFGQFTHALGGEAVLFRHQGPLGLDLLLTPGPLELDLLFDTEPHGGWFYSSG